jgi:hypothetical protein|tara:strand:- start:3411 stop:3632 length:222 start_codon:yes stop_codon:yes gene_type:complete
VKGEKKKTKMKQKEKMNKYIVYRTTLSSIELEGKSLKDINNQIEEIDGDDKDWVYYEEEFKIEKCVNGIYDGY